VLWLLWLLLPPHADNIGVVDYLHRSARRLAGKQPPGISPHSSVSSFASSRTSLSGAGLLQRRAAPEESPNRSDPHKGLWCRTLSSARPEA
jgi:hypothetical protein